MYHTQQCLCTKRQLPNWKIFFYSLLQIPDVGKNYIPANSELSLILFSVNEFTECLTSSRGGEYKGRANVTRSGRACQPWAEQSPHSHTAYEALFNDSNYCRNLYPNSNYHPWCYTMDPNKRWEYCDIPACGMELGSNYDNYNIDLFQPFDCYLFLYIFMGWFYILTINFDGVNIHKKA